RLLPELLEGAWGLIDMRAVQQRQRAITRTQKRGDALRIGATEAHNANDAPGGIQHWAAAIAMFDVPANLNELRAVVIALERADTHIVDRRCQQVCRITIDITIPRKPDDRQRILYRQLARRIELNVWRIGESYMDQREVIFGK